MTSQSGQTVVAISRAMQIGLEHHQAGRLPEAERAYQQVLQVDPNNADALHLLGVIAHQVGRNELSVRLIARALEIRPEFAVAHSNLGNSLRELGQLDAAVASCRRALEISPDLAGAHHNLGNALKDLGQLDSAVASYQRALEIAPEYAKAHNDLGNALRELGRADSAVASYRRALEIEPNLAMAHSNLGNALRDRGQLESAAASYRRALEIAPDYAEARSNLGDALRDLGQLDEALASYRRALEIKPDLANAHSNLLFAYAYQALIAPAAYLEEARRWERIAVPEAERLAASRRIFPRPASPGRRLRVGYVSGDFWNHVLSLFIGRLFARHDRTRVEVFAYSSGARRDAVTERLQRAVEHWVPLLGMSDARARERIEADGIDVLVDLSGHTGGHRLGVFARRAAPVQAHYAGYFASTGLSEMDHWIGDEVLTPAQHESHFSEQVWRLPRVWMSYDGQPDAPSTDWSPAADGTVWLGSFNNLGKVTLKTLALWARVLEALPEGRLLLKTRELADAANRQRVMDAMGSHGIAPERIELRDRSATPDWPAHMAYYDRLDIALDPAGGLSGTTTTCDALWMGVPVLTLLGDRMAARISAAMVAAIGHPEWCAQSEDEYVTKAVALARDVDRRKALRASQRARMARSPLCDSDGMARCLEQAYADMFGRWLERGKAA